MSQTEKYTIFVCYYEQLAEDYANVIHKVLTELGYRVFVAHIRRPYISGDFRKFIDSVIDGCNTFVLINSLDALSREEIIREITHAFPNGDLSGHEFWIFRENNIDVPRGSDVFKNKTKIDLNNQNQSDFSNPSELARSVLRKCKRPYENPELLVQTPVPPVTVELKITSTNKINLNQINLNLIIDSIHQATKNKDYQLVLEFYEQLSSIDPFNLAIFNNKGVQQSLLGHYEDAVESYSLALSINSKLPFIWANKALALQKLERYRESLECIDKALAEKPKEIDYILTKAFDLFYLNQFDDALKIYDDALIWSQNSKLLSSRSSVLFTLGRKEEAIKLLETAIRNDPKNDNAWYNFGVMLNDEGKYEEALKKYEKAVEINPKDHRTWNNMAVIMRRLGKIEESLKIYDKAIEIDSKYFLPYFNKGIGLSLLEKYPESIDNFNQVLKLNPKYISAYVNKAISLFRIGNKKESIDNIKTALDIDENDFNANKGAGIIYLESEDYAIAEKYLQKAHGNKPNDLNIAQQLLVSLNKQNKNQKALELCNSVLTQYPQDIRFLIGRSYDLVKLKEYDRAIDDCNNTLKIDNTVGTAYYNKSCVMSIRRDIDESIKLLTKAIALDKGLKELARNDADFINLRTDERFKKLINS